MKKLHGVVTWYDVAARRYHGALAWVVLLVGVLGSFGLMYAAVVIGQSRMNVPGMLRVWIESMLLFLAAMAVFTLAVVAFLRVTNVGPSAKN